MLTYHLETRGTVPLYIYLYTCIKSDIISGIIQPDEKLPSKRNLAEHLKISVMTVQNAYLQLLSEGYLYSRYKSGYYASVLEGGAPNIPERLSTGESTEKGAAEYLVDFCENSINLERFPFTVWSREMREVLSERSDKLLRKIPPAGVPELRKAIADFLYQFRGMTVTPEQIIIGAGTEYLYGLLVKLLGKNNVYAVEDPGYGKIAEIYQSEEVTCRHIGLDGSGISAEELFRSGADIVHISPSHHFPTGIVMPIKRRQELLNWADEAANRYIIEDDYDSEFRFTGKAIPTMQSIDAYEKVIYMNTFSKTISPAIRISYMVLPFSLMKKYKEELGFYSCTVSSFEQYTLARFMEKGYFERHINRMRKAYKLKRDTIIKAIKAGPLGQKAEILEENSGLHFIMKLKTEKSDEELVHAAEQQGIKISCVSQYCHTQDHVSSSMAIINYSGIRTEMIEEAISKLTRIL